MLGGKFDFDLASRKRGEISITDPLTDKLVLTKYQSVLKRTDFGAEIGVGLSLYLRYATVSPEVKFSYGLRNLNKNDLLLSNLDRITSNFIYFTIHIEN